MFGIPWHRLPTLLALLKLAGFRKELRKKNLQDTSQLPDTDKLPDSQPSPDYQTQTSFPTPNPAPMVVIY